MTLDNLLLATRNVAIISACVVKLVQWIAAWTKPKAKRAPHTGAAA